MMIVGEIDPCEGEGNAIEQGWDWELVFVNIGEFDHVWNTRGRSAKIISVGVDEIMRLGEFLQALDLCRIHCTPFIIVLRDAVELNDKLLNVLKQDRIQVSKPGILSSLDIHLEKDAAVLREESREVGGAVGLLVMDVLLHELDVSGIMIRIIMDGPIECVGIVLCHPVGLNKVSRETLFVAHTRGEVEVVSSWYICDDVSSISLGAVTNFFVNVVNGQYVETVHSYS